MGSKMNGVRIDEGYFHLIHFSRDMRRIQIQETKKKDADRPIRNRRRLPNHK